VVIPPHKKDHPHCPWQAGGLTLKQPVAEVESGSKKMIPLGIRRKEEKGCFTPHIFLKKMPRPVLLKKELLPGMIAHPAALYGGPENAGFFQSYHYI